MATTHRSPLRNLLTFAAAAMLLAACGAPASSSPVASLEPEPSIASMAPSESQAPSPAAEVITVNEAPLEDALVVTWEEGGTAAKPCTANPAIAPDGRVWVAACWENAFWIFEPDGTFVEAWGTPGSGDGEFNFGYAGGQDAMAGVAFASDGTFYTFEAGNARVQRFSADRAFLGTWGSFGIGDGQFSKPTDIGIDDQDQVYVGDGARHDVQVFASDGTFLRSIAEGIAGARNGFVYMAVDGSGNVFMDHEGSFVEKFASDGTELALYDVSAIAPDTADVAVGDDGHLFVSGYTSEDEPVGIFELDADGQAVHSWPATGETLAVDEANHALYAAHWSWGFIRQYTLPAD